MAQIIINIPEDKVDWVLDGFAKRYKYLENIVNPEFDESIPEDPVTNPSTIPNPQNKAGFAKSWLIEMIKREAAQGHINTHWDAEKTLAESVNLT